MRVFQDPASPGSINPAISTIRAMPDFFKMHQGQLKKLPLR